MAAEVYLIPTVLADGSTDCIPSYVLEAARKCQVFYVENERTARRYLKLLSREIVIDDYRWYNIKDPQAVAADFKKDISAGNIVGIISEAGCPGVADPGQALVAIAQQMQAAVKPLVGPNSILLALMGSGMNGQQFAFHGYLPIDAGARNTTIKNLESESRQKDQTQIFIETPYRNNQLLDALVKTCKPDTKICVAVDLTAQSELVKTMTVAEWRKQMPDIHKRPAIFLLFSGQVPG